MTKAEKWQRTRLVGFECGFGYFVGDVIKHPTKTNTGIITCIFRQSKALSIRWDNDKIGHFSNATRKPKLEKVGRKVSPLFPKEVLAWIYSQYDLENKIFFMYHWKGASKESAELVADYLNVSLKRVKETLQTFRDKGFI